MAETAAAAAAAVAAESSSPAPSIDPRSGFCAATRTFHSLRPASPLPPPSLPLSFPSFAFSFLPSSPLPSHPALVDAANGDAISYPELLSQTRSLAAALRSTVAVSKGDVAFVLSPPRLDVPVLYLALLSLGVVVSPANPVSTPPEISRLVGLSRPSVAFATSSTAHKLPSDLPTVLLDSPRFRSFLKADSAPVPDVEIMQSDTAAIQYSSGTTGQVKAAALPHRSFIAMAAGFHALRPVDGPQVTLLGAPMFHSLGFFFALKGVALAETTVVMTAEASRYGLPALRRVVCGGAPLHVAAARRFQSRFPRVELQQGYGATEAGGISRMINPEECCHLRSAGRLAQNVEVKIVDHVTGNILSVGQKGELWVRGPALMKGYVGDDEANASAFDSEGWLKTGDLCYIDQDGFVHVVDRLKELIKYKAYQVPPAELEHVLQSSPKILDAAVIPYPHEEAGQIPVALVVRQPGCDISETEVMDYVAQQVAPYKKIRKVLFVDRIPKSPSGKILRREIINQICGSVSRL
ncbi:4-coumarate--CoA ligase-like 7 isoform X2 [Ananas comosus]|uniref:4-coumarate--CoA ligase n=1 Tax=Ananas comosus TaxID=4615 RepID=A0A6P5GCR4_ANACO|nr:4-coumarate--CoA ligase-like 7 isoform X2 [Ananas comosus]